MEILVTFWFFILFGGFGNKIIGFLGVKSRTRKFMALFVFKKKKSLKKSIFRLKFAFYREKSGKKIYNPC